jgi:hypothetical protein
METGRNVIQAFLAQSSVNACKRTLDQIELSDLKSNGPSITAVSNKPNLLASPPQLSTRKPTAIEQQCVEAEGQDGKAIETAEQRANYNRCIEAHAVEIPKQYRGAWCETKWQNIYKRCSDADFEVKRTYWTTVESTCNVLSVRKSKYGGHRLLAICEGDEGSRDMPNRVEVRWWLGTNNTRLQTIRGYEPP